MQIEFLNCFQLFRLSVKFVRITTALGKRQKHALADARQTTIGIIIISDSECKCFIEKTTLNQ